MPDRWLEMHDSRLGAIETVGDSVRLHLDGYVHQWEATPEGAVGTGWVVPVVIDVRGATALGGVELPSSVWDGELLAGYERRINLVPLPYSSTDDVSLILDLNSGARLELYGTAIRITAGPGEPRYVERLTDDLMPDGWSG